MQWVSVERQPTLQWGSFSPTNTYPGRRAGWLGSTLGVFPTDRDTRKITHTGQQMAREILLPLILLVTQRTFVQFRIFFCVIDVSCYQQANASVDPIKHFWAFPREWRIFPACVNMIVLGYRIKKRDLVLSHTSSI